MIICDLCGKKTLCLPREIDGLEYDICSDCWEPFTLMLKGKGRVKKDTEMITLPRQITVPEPKETKPMPGEPPKIWSSV
jgi:ribosome-binding protein aMBF1 (putative translation factor)